MSRQASPFPEVFRPVPYAQMFRDVPTADLLAELEISRWEALEAGEDIAHPHSRVIHEQAIAAIAAELERRQRLLARHTGDPIAPQWPDRDTQLRDRVQAVKDRWPIEVFVEQILYTPLVRAGAELKGRCPFPGHDDSDPSFYVNQQKQVGLCRGCGRGGDVLALTGHFFEIERFTEKLALLEEMSGIGRAA